MFACYCRVSSSHQRTDSQKAEIKKWLKFQNITEKQVQWFEDKETGKTLDRPKFKEMQKEVFGGKIKTVVVWKLDRISRNLKDGVNLLADWCEKDIRVVVITQQLDLSGPLGRMIAGVLFGLAEIENVHRHERQAAGIEVAKTRGVYKGRAKGATKSSASRCKELRDQGFKIKEISNGLGVSIRTVSRYLEG